MHLDLLSICLLLGVAVGAHAYRRTIEGRAAASIKQKYEKNPEKDESVAPEKGKMISANKQKTPGG